MRKIFKLPYNTHRYLLPGIANQYGLRCDLDTRWCKFISQFIGNGNTITSTLAMRNICFQEGIIGRNVKYLFEAYGISYSDILHSSAHTLVQRIRLCHLQSKCVQGTVNQIVELQTHDIPGFSSEEKQDILSFLCTE